MAFNNKEGAFLTRQEAKKNLKLVIETTIGLKLENSSFDRYWFDERKLKLTIRDKVLPPLVT
jgi:hypothetical protein